MARFARGSTLPRTRSLRRKTAWDNGPGGSTVTQFSASSTSILGAGGAAVVEGLTIVRIRGNLEAYMRSTVAATDDGWHCALGIAVVTNEAFAIGATAIPSPIADLGFDGWMYHRIFDLHAGGTTIENQYGTHLRFEVDTKAMRKFDVGLTVVAVCEVVEAGTAALSVFFDSRVLVKLP